MASFLSGYSLSRLRERVGVRAEHDPLLRRSRMSNPHPALSRKRERVKKIV